jgi:group I intron endonuclease
MHATKPTNRPEQRAHHIIYKTICTATNKYYIGMHSTDNLEDGYIGSGQILWRSIKKYGKDLHVCEILEHLPDRKSLIERESEMVNVEIINDPMCMNIRLGGSGNRPGNKASEETKAKMSAARKGKPKPVGWAEKMSEKFKDRKDPRSKEGVEAQRAKVTGRVMTDEERAMRSEAALKAGNYKQRAILIDGIEYANCKVAGLELGISPSTINKRCSSTVNLQYYFKDAPKQ